MAHIVYCVTVPQPNLAVLSKGIREEPISVIVEDSLGAVVSAFFDHGLFPSSSDVLSYGKVIEAFHKVGTVIPMRFGCIFDGAPGVRQMLRERREEFHSLMNHLQGMVEMGVRFTDLRSSSAGCPRPLARLSSTGTAYLAAKKEQYTAIDRSDQELDSLGERIRASLLGLFAQSRTESKRSATDGMFSICFLIPRASVQAFRERIRQSTATASGEILVTGPWPPYNFV